MPQAAVSHRLIRNLPRLLACIILVGGVAISAVVASNTRALIHSEATTEFDQVHEKLKSELQARFLRPRYGLRGARGVYAASASVERAEFGAYVASRDLNDEFPGILGMGVIKPVARADLPSFIASERADGTPDFAVTSNGSDGQCYVITSIFPKATNQKAWGFDVGSEQIRRAAIEEAIASGEATMTHRISLVQDQERTPGFLLLQPVFRRGIRTDLQAERRAGLDVLVYAPIRAVDLLQGLDDSGLGRAVATVWEGDVLSEDSCLYPQGGRPQRGALIVREEVVRIHGRDLHLAVESTPMLDAAMRSSQPGVILGAGAMVSALLALTLLWLSTKLTRMLASHRDLSGSLREATSTAENAVREAEAYRITLDRYAIVSMTDASGRIIGVNDAFCAISGYAREELLGRDHRLINSGHHPPAFWQEMWSTIQAGRPWRGIVRNRRKDGSLYWVDSMIAPFTGPDGTIQRFVSIRFDITAHVAAQGDLHDLSERLKLALMGGEVGTWDFDIVNNRLVWDERMYQLYGVSPDRFRRRLRSLVCLRPSRGPGAGPETCSIVRVRGEAKFDTEFRISRPDGSVRHIRARAQVQRDADGRALRHGGHQLGHHPRARGRSRPGAPEEYPRPHARRRGGGQLRWPSSAFLNRAGRDLIGLDPNADLTGMLLAQLHPEWANAKTRSEGYPAVLAVGIWQCESAVRHRDGSEIPVSKVLILHRREDGQPEYLSTILRDLRPQKQIENDLRQLATLHQGILGSANVAVIAGDTTGLITVWKRRGPRACWDGPRKR